MADVKHGGCHDCGSKEQKILISVPCLGQTVGKAVCNKCLKK